MMKKRIGSEHFSLIITLLVKVENRKNASTHTKTERYMLHPSRSEHVCRRNVLRIDASAIT